ncbi:MAG: hypothetical protein ACRD0P_07540 [Stackebrandtia sp.]
MDPEQPPRPDNAQSVQPIMPFGPAPSVEPVPPPEDEPPATPPRHRRNPYPSTLGLVIGLVCLLAVTGLSIGLLWDSGPQPGSDPDDSSKPESIEKAFDPDNASIYLSSSGLPSAKVELTDGEYADEHGREMTRDSKPVYTDVDDDGDNDVAVILHWSGTKESSKKGWRAVYLWRWEDGAVKPVPARATYQADCAKGTDLSIKAAKSGLTVTRAPHNSCYADEDLDAESVTVKVRENTPVVVAGDHIGSVQRCWKSKNGDEDQRTDAGKAGQPRVLPEAKSVAVGEDFKSIEVFIPKKPEHNLTNGHLSALVIWSDGTELCGWVPWEDIEDAASKNLGGAAVHRP